MLHIAGSSPQTNVLAELSALLMSPLSRHDRDFSLADCSSFVTMQKERLGECLTSDAHFEQAGLVRLLK
jgi:predicted nucleic acid-binding protein